MSAETQARCGAMCPLIYKGDEGPCYCYRPLNHDGDHEATYSASHALDSNRQWPRKSAAVGGDEPSRASERETKLIGALNGVLASICEEIDMIAGECVSMLVAVGEARDVLAEYETPEDTK